MSDFDLSRVSDLLARLDGPVPCDGVMGVDEAAVIAERAEAAAAIRALMAANRRLAASEVSSEVQLSFANEARRLLDASLDLPLGTGIVSWVSRVRKLLWRVVKWGDGK